MAHQYLTRLFEKVPTLAEKHPYLAFGSSLYVAVITFFFLKRRQQRSSTKLTGPPSTNRLMGVMRDIMRSSNSAALYEGWAKTYGPVYEIPMPLGNTAIVLLEPKAMASMLSKDTSVYHQPSNLVTFMESIYGKSLLITDGEDHKRQRRALSSGFSIAAIRKVVPVFYESVNNVTDGWKTMIEASTGSAIIDVQHWMNNITLDSIGKGGFSHDFRATLGEDSTIAQDFDSFGDLQPSLFQVVILLLANYFPALLKIPTERIRLHQSLAGSFAQLATTLLEKAKQEKAMGVNEGLDKSIIGALIRSETGSSNVRMDLDEIRAQNLLMMAGYETTSISLTWALIELSRHQDIQKKLREEISQFVDEDPTYEQLGDLPYLDAVVCETLRLHPSLAEFSRVANEDDVIPLGESIVDASGKTIDRIFVSKGAMVRIPINAINRLEDLWGEDNHEFQPDRWIDDKISSTKAAKIQGHRHLLTFADGPRSCLGKQFAWTQIKAVLSVLIRNFTFELPDGPETKIDLHRGMLPPVPRPKIAGEKGARVPLIVRKVNEQR